MDKVNNLMLSIGSNLGDRFDILERSKQAIENQLGTIYKSSSYWENEPWGFESQHWFLNACLWVKTLKDPNESLRICQTIEQSLGKIGNSTLCEENKTYVSRNIDLDIVFFNDCTIEQSNLSIPHPQFKIRKFVLHPLIEIMEDDPFNYSKKEIEIFLENVTDSSQIFKFQQK